MEKQNKNLINISSSTYYEMHESLELIGKKIVAVEEKIKNFELESKISHSEIKLIEKNSEYKTIPQLEDEIHDLEEEVKKCNHIISDKKHPIDKLNKTITEDTDYMMKIIMEKKSIVDTIKEEKIIKVTYNDNFSYDYQYDIMDRILHELNKISFIDKAKHKFQELYTGNNMDAQLEKLEIEKIRKELIIENFKVIIL